MGNEILGPPTIELTGLRLRPLVHDDADALYAYLHDPRVTEFTGYPVVTRALVDAIIERSRSRWEAGELAKWGVALPDNDQVIGTCGFNEHAHLHRWAELAYDLAPLYWGQGYMRRAVDAVLSWTFQQQPMDRIHAYVRVDNQRSKQLLERIGFSREGRLRSYRICRGTPHDFFVYSLLRAEWEPWDRGVAEPLPSDAAE